MTTDTDLTARAGPTASDWLWSASLPAPGLAWNLARVQLLHFAGGELRACPLIALFIAVLAADIVATGLPFNAIL